MGCTGVFTLRYYRGCPDILDVWIFESNVSIENITIQDDEVCDAMWACVEEIKRLYEDKKFEANAFFEEILASSKN